MMSVLCIWPGIKMLALTDHCRDCSFSGLPSDNIIALWSLLWDIFAKIPFYRRCKYGKVFPVEIPWVCYGWNAPKIWNNPVMTKLLSKQRKREVPEKRTTLRKRRLSKVEGTFWGDFPPCWTSYRSHIYFSVKRRPHFYRNTWEIKSQWDLW